MIAYFPEREEVMVYDYNQPLPEGEVEVYNIDITTTKLQESELEECDECHGKGYYLIDGEPIQCICKEAQELFDLIME